MDNEKLTYKDAGVDTKEGERAVSLMKEHVKKTFNPNVRTGLGSFGSLFRLPCEGMKEPVLVAGTDGVGTKLKIAFLTDRHDTVGQDCVAMCVNDVLCQGATPLFFLDYIATGKVTAEKIADIVKGVADGCVLGQCALVGGETAEMPDFYGEDEYDMAGFCVGLVDREKMIAALERAALVTEEKIAGSVRSHVKLEFEAGVLQISAVSTLGSTYDEIEIEQEGDRILIAFNNRFLLDSLRASDAQKVRISMTSALTSINIEPAEADEESTDLFMLLPVRMKE